MLIENGANINLANNQGFTPLQQNCTPLESYNITKYLLKKGADVNYVDNYGKTPII